VASSGAGFKPIGRSSRHRSFPAETMFEIDVEHIAALLLGNNEIVSLNGA
jgi:hypothetical protein